jgi:drug/metabolite transporter (DMT)-like permease
MKTRFQNSAIVTGILICLLGAICFSTKAVIVKVAYRDTHIDAVSLLALRMIFSLPFFIISAFISSSKTDNVKFTGRQWAQIAVIGCLGYYVSSLLDFLGLQYISAGIERLVLFVYPTLVLLIAAIFFRRKITSVQWIAVAITYAGLIVAFIGEMRNYSTEDNNLLLGSALIFACAVTYALYIVGSGKIIPEVGARKFNSYAMSFACLAVLIHYMATSESSLTSLSFEVYGYSLLMAVLSTVIPSYLVTEGIKRIGSGNAAIVGSVGPISTILQAAIFLGERITLLQIAGTILVLAGVLVIGAKKERAAELPSDVKPGGVVSKL